MVVLLIVYNAGSYNSSHLSVSFFLYWLLTIFKTWKIGHPLKWNVFYPMFANCVHFNRYWRIPFTFGKMFENPEMLVWLRRRHFWQFCRKVISKMPKFSRWKSEKNHKNIYFRQKILRSSSGDIECNFDNLAEVFPSKVRKCIGQNPKTLTEI